MIELENVPFVGPLLAAGADDPVFDVLLLLGPFVIVAIAVLGRRPLSTALATAYTAFFAGYVAFVGISDGNT